MKKNKNSFFRHFLLIFLISVIIFNTGFIQLGSNNLYYYQWGLQNTGYAAIKKEVLTNNYSVNEFDFLESYVSFNNLKNNLSYFTTTNDQSFVLSKKGADINYNQAYTLYNSIKNKKEVVVAIIDSGVDINHECLKNNIWVNKKEIPNNFKDDDANGFIDDYFGWNFYDENNIVYVNQDIDIHGTHAAGIVAASYINGYGIKGIASSDEQKVKIMPIKVLGANGKGSVSSLVKAIKYAHDNGARICNISLGFYNDNSDLEEIISLYSDMLFVVAAGNGLNFVGYDIDAKKVYPASYNYDNVLTVSSLAMDGMPYVSGNYGSSVDIYAPGTYILSTIPLNKFGYLTGTSMAAPFATGVAAMLMSVKPSLTAIEVKEIIKTTVTQTEDLHNSCSSNGYLNAFNAIKRILVE